jgi:alkyl sulfatase BDS1-like metallo-beta-lactamase superfamily hydrolase
MSQARALEGQLKLPILMLPSVEQVKAADPGLFVDYQRVRLDPAKSSDVDAMLRIEFSDAAGKAYGLHVRRGVAEFIDKPDGHARKADYTVRLDRETWARLYRGEIDIGQALASGKAQAQGDARGIERFFAMFDRFDPGANSLIPTARAGE